MSVRKSDDGSIVLIGECPVEEAEPLLRLFQENPRARLDWTSCRYLHTAILQVILAAKPPLVGPCGDEWVEQWVAAIAHNEAFR